MKDNGPWAIVLAAGDGSRLRSLTTDPDGRVVPKQFCSLDGGPTLFELALERAHAVAAPERVIKIVAAQHAAHWRSLSDCGPPRNWIVQPENRGTAAGLLLPLLAVLARDPEATVAVLPSDHFVRNERLLCRALFEACGSVGPGPNGTPTGAETVTVLGIRPEEAVSDYGWILPAEQELEEREERRLRPIHRFVEKPEPSLAAELFAAGGLWNSFLLAARAAALLDLYRARLPGLVASFQSEGRDPSADPERLAALYRQLDVQDFSRDVLQQSESRLRVLEVPPCGWTDLGTPERVLSCLRDGRERWCLPRPQSSSTRILALALRERALDDALDEDSQLELESERGVLWPVAPQVRRQAQSATRSRTRPSRGA